MSTATVPTATGRCRRRKPVRYGFLALGIGTLTSNVAHTGSGQKYYGLAKRNPKGEKFLSREEAKWEERLGMGIPDALPRVSWDLAVVPKKGTELVRGLGDGFVLDETARSGFRGEGRPPGRR